MIDTGTTSTPIPWKKIDAGTISQSDDLGVSLVKTRWTTSQVRELTDAEISGRSQKIPATRPSSATYDMSAGKQAGCGPSRSVHSPKYYPKEHINNTYHKIEAGIISQSDDLGVSLLELRWAPSKVRQQMRKYPGLEPLDFRPRNIPATRPAQL